MKNNLPIIDQEFGVPPGATLMSTTDVHSRITYANEAFVQVSGFSREELIGQPHNMVRHPDMPEEAFRDMWQTLKAGQPWSGIVKNRRKDGTFYWVRANVAPVHRQGKLAGYLSVRVHATKQEVSAAQHAYAAMKKGPHSSLALFRGVVVHRGLWRMLTLSKTVSVKSRLRVVLGTAGLLLSALLGATSSGAATGGLVLGAVAVTFTLACLLLEHQLERPLQEVLEQAQAVAAGHLPTIRALERTDHIGLLMRAVNQAGLNMQAMVADVYEQTHGLSAAGQQIAQGGDALQARVEQAATSLQQTAAAVEELSGTIAANASTAQQATVFAREATSAAQEGERAVQDAVATMTSIRASSEQVLGVVGVIDDLAFRTNLLALNAAVEAARAGPQGAGFSVVAAEVRALAQRSAQAAQQVKRLIEESAAQVHKGAERVVAAGTTMEHFIHQVTLVATMVDEIGSATGEQASGMKQISQATALLDHDTQHNAALAVQSAAAASDLRQRSEALMETLAVFDASAR